MMPKRFKKTAKRHKPGIIILIRQTVQCNMVDYYSKLIIITSNCKLCIQIGQVALKQIKLLQTTTHLLLRKLPFQRLVCTIIFFYYYYYYYYYYYLNN